MGPKKTKKTKNQKAPPAKDDRLLRFAREHSLGVVIVALLTSGGGWLAWSIRNCLIDQKLQLAATRKAWTNVRTTYQKTSDNTHMLFRRMDMYREAKERGESVTLDQQRKALFDLGQVANADCNAGKAALYEFTREFEALRQLFSSKANLLVPDLSKQCEKPAYFVEEFRTPRLTDEEVSNPVDLKKAEEIVRLVEVADEMERETDRKLSAFFSELENEGVMHRVFKCF